jgi:asparagine synthase (glutamine-hydrolysing)
VELDSSASGRLSGVDGGSGVTTLCGIAGVWAPERGSDELAAAASEMGNVLRHRGPDGSGVWTDAQSGVALSHRRLAIVDLTEAGRQPMVSVSGRFAVSFNGEIYNFQHLRDELLGLGHTFRGGSDTEVMLAAIEQWRIEGAVRKFIGMFAIALWDAKDRMLHLIRDRVGKKPIYFADRVNEFAFASELKALYRLYSGNFRIDRNSLTQYMRFQYVPAPRSIFENVWKVCPGEIVSVALSERRFVVAKKSYWSALDVYADAANNTFRGTMAEAETELERLLLDSVRLRMIADVPLGAFLSGGIDSSMVVACMQRLGSRPAKTFSIGFSEDEFDESKHAALVARHLNTDHTELIVSSSMALSVVPDLPRIYDEPFGDASGIPTFLVAKLAREHVTVALSGDGGDELFCGYNRYLWWRFLWPKIRWMPSPARRTLGAWVLKYDSEQWNAWLTPVVRMLPNSKRHLAPGSLLRKGAETLLVTSPASLYLKLVSHWREPESVVLGGAESSTIIDEAWPVGIDARTIHMTLLDILTYLPDDILVKVDRATMATSLEARCPLLDHRLVEFAARLPLQHKVSAGKGKAVLRSLLYKYVPQPLVDRPKTGFGIPLASWLRGPLKDWGESLLDARSLESQAYVDVQVVRRTWDDFQSGKNDAHYPLWTLLMFQAWLNAWT